LIGVEFKNRSLRNLGIELRKPLVISPRVGLLDLLREFRKGKSHIAILTEKVKELQEKLGLNRSNSIEKIKEMREKQPKKNVTVLGIITLEDVIEKMINLDILDEDDYERTKSERKKQKMSKNNLT
jgi:metal transporter CNNM